MKINWQTDLYCLIGNPISKSLSPDIHNYFFEINNLNKIYLAFDVEKEYLETVIKSFKALNIKGFNVTIPYKIEIMNYLDELTKESKILGAVNTVVNKEGKLIGDNTDGKGFITALEKNIDIKDKKVLILGAGGAAHAIGFSLAMEGVKEIIILNRTEEKARNLRNKIRKKFSSIIVDSESIYEFNSEWLDVDIIINCTSLGMYPNVKDIPLDLSKFNKKTIVFDIVYKPLKTKFIKRAEKNGLRTINGLSMLVNQAILSQQIWDNLNEKSVEKNRKKIKGFLYDTIEYL